MPDYRELLKARQRDRTALVAKIDREIKLLEQLAALDDPKEKRPSNVVQGHGFGAVKRREDSMPSRVLTVLREADGPLKVEQIRLRLATRFPDLDVNAPKFNMKISQAIANSRPHVKLVSRETGWQFITEEGGEHASNSNDTANNSGTEAEG